MKKKAKIIKKINRVWNILSERLPKGYCAPIKCYSSIYSLLRAYASENNQSYDKYIDWVYKHWEEQEEKGTEYIDTKYYDPKQVSHSQTVFKIVAISTNPVKLACDNIRYHTEAEICYVLLHEFAHILFNIVNEKKCDEFAIRWIKKLIKEGLIKNESSKCS